MKITLADQYGMARNRHGIMERTYDGEVEFEIRSAKTHAVLEVIRCHNIIKVFAKEIFAHCIPSQEVWDPNFNGGTGDWVDSGLNLGQYSPKYIIFGASYDVNGLPLDTADTRFYIYDDVSQSYVPRALDVGATFNGGLINPIPIAEPVRPLKRIERIYFEPSYQPAGVPLLQSDVRAINNVLVLETTLQQDEYNGFGLTAYDYFTITEVGLVGAPQIGLVGNCGVDPHSLFVNGNAGIGLECSTSGTATITLTAANPLNMINMIQEGDQIMIVAHGGTITANTLGQVSPYYLVISKVNGGSDIVLDRTPVDFNNVPLTGNIAVFQDQFRLFSHRIMVSPIKKSADFEITCRWRILID